MVDNTGDETMTSTTFTCPRCSHVEHDEACDICPACKLDWTDNSDWTPEMMAAVEAQGYDV